MALRAGLKHLFSDTAAFIISGTVIVSAIWYVADIPKKVEAHELRLGKLEQIKNELDDINQRLARIEGRLEGIWRQSERRQSR